MWSHNLLTQKLGIRLPIIQGPFGGGLSSVDLLVAVSEAGGLGSYGAHILTADEIIALAAEIRRRTDKPFALNLWVSDHDPGGLDLDEASYDQRFLQFESYYRDLHLEKPAFQKDFSPRFEDQIEAVLEAAPKVFSFVYGIPSPEIIRACRKRGIITVGAATTLDEALAIEQAGIDVVLATGFEAGGHRPSFLKRAEDSLMGTLSLIPQVVDRVKIPVIAAGGMADARGVAAALTLGASAVQMGTAFLACEESAASQEHRDLLFDEAVRETKLSRAFTGRLARFHPTKVLNELETKPGNILPYPMQSLFTAPIKRAAIQQHNRDFQSLYAGQGAPLIKHKRAGAFMQALEQEVSHIFSPK